ncbi:MAG TPA: DUF192 domain-containing protein [Gaiellaceae bacterium]|nr:DUF192 domain-containing protein [Gaiellaceae bacterium]
MRLVLTAIVCALALAACGGDDDGGAGAGPQVLIDTGEEQIAVDVEVADSDEERAAGLMHRESLPEDAGMIFVFPEEASGGFWMKNTLIPLSIAFADADGRILRILDMEPCEADPCRIYDPGVSYRSALEVNRGAFADWGVEEGDRLTLETVRR